MPKDMILGLVGGLGFFLFGMKLMSEGLRKVAGDHMTNVAQSVLGGLRWNGEA